MAGRGVKSFRKSFPPGCGVSVGREGFHESLIERLLKIYEALGLANHYIAITSDVEKAVEAYGLNGPPKPGAEPDKSSSSALFKSVGPKRAPL